MNRALEKLRKLFAKRGAVWTTAFLARAISANSVQAAPAALAAKTSVKPKKTLARLPKMSLTDWLVSRKDKHNLYYLFPGMGKGARKRFVRNMIIAVVVGSILSAGIWAVAYFMSR